jgi:hypothetical protein
MELGKNFKEMWKNLMILRKDLLGTGANIDEEEDDDDEDD